ncbi:MAG: hypothetical protein WC568_05055 [Candidatus Methanoperedens sp.]
MNKLLSIFIILFIFAGAASAADISGSVVSFGKKLPGQEVALSRVNTTEGAETGVVYTYMPLSNLMRESQTSGKSCCEFQSVRKD